MEMSWGSVESSVEGMKLVTRGVSWQDSREGSVPQLWGLLALPKDTVGSGSSSRHSLLLPAVPSALRDLRGPLHPVSWPQPLTGTVPGVSLGTQVHVVTSACVGAWAGPGWQLQGTAMSRARRLPHGPAAPPACHAGQGVQDGHCLLSF